MATDAAVVVKRRHREPPEGLVRDAEGRAPYLNHAGKVYGDWLVGSHVGWCGPFAAWNATCVRCGSARVLSSQRFSPSQRLTRCTCHWDARRKQRVEAEAARKRAIREAVLEERGVLAHGLRLTKSEWADEMGVSRQRVDQRLNKYRDPEIALWKRDNMAEVVEKSRAFWRAAIGGAPKYPWEQWLDGQVWALTPKVDFSAGMRSMRVFVHQTATRRGMRVRTRIGLDGLLYIQAIKRKRKPR